MPSQTWKLEGILPCTWQGQIKTMQFKSLPHAPTLCLNALPPPSTMIPLEVQQPPHKLLLQLWPCPWARSSVSLDRCASQAPRNPGIHSQENARALPDGRRPPCFPGGPGGMWLCALCVAASPQPGQPTLPNSPLTFQGLKCESQPTPPPHHRKCHHSLESSGSCKAVQPNS